MLENASNQPSKFRTKKWVEVNNDSRGTCNTNSEILFDYSDAYIVVKGTLLIQRVAAPKAADNDAKEVVFKNCASFASCVSEINNTQIDNANNID